MSEKKAVERADVSAQRIGSPCVRNCCLNSDDICMGCFRSLDEILCWAASDDDHRSQILADCDKRRQQCQLR